MSTRIIGSLEVQGNLQINGKYAMRVFNGIAATANTGDVPFPFYRKGVVDTIMGMLPVSRIGTMDYLPINISGSFVGASSYSYTDYIQPIVVEDDGTVVMLRSGTNGSSTGFYYGYIRNIRNLTTIQQSDMVITNSEYRPAFFEANQKIDHFFSTDAYELLFYKTTGASVGTTYVLSMTNSTLNAVSHERSQFLPSALSANFDPVAASVIGNEVYIWGQDTSVRAVNNGIAFLVYKVPVSSIRAGNMTGLTQVTGFSGTTVRSKAYSASPTIQIYDRYSSTSAADNPLYLYSSNMNTLENWNNLEKYNFRAVGNSNNSVIRCAMWFSTRAVTTPLTSSMMGSGFSFTFNVNTKAITFDTAVGNPIQISAVFNTPSSVTFNRVDPYQIDTMNITGHPLSLGNTGSICQTYDGFLVSNKSRWSSSPTFGTEAVNITPTSQFDSWNLKNRKGTGARRLDVQPVFGSAIGENLLGIRFLTKNKFVLACAGTKDGVTYGYESYSTSTLSSARNYTYQSLNSGTLTGYAPQARSLLGTTGNDQYTGMISLIEANGDVSAYATSFIEGYNKPTQGKYNASTGVFDGTYTMSDTVMQNIKNQVISASGVNGLTTSLVTVYYVPDSTFGNSYAIVLGNNVNTSTGVMLIGEVTLTLSGTAITGATVVKVTSKTDYGNVANTTSQSTTRRFTGLTIGKFSGFLYVGISPSHCFNVPANTQWPLAICKSKGGSISSTKWIFQSYTQFGGQEPGIIPGVGFGIYNHSNSDQATKSVFSLYGTTEAQMDGLIGSGAELEKVVMASQEVPQGYNVYFTQEVPVFLGGIFDKIPQVSYDLTSFKANPANSTFYVYVQMNRSTRKASYLISESLIAESLTSTYIGTIKTGSTGISDIVSEKVTRFQTYRPSVTKRGSAIPCSTGVPSGTGTRWK